MIILREYNALLQCNLSRLEQDNESDFLSRSQVDDIISFLACYILHIANSTLT